MTPVEQIKEIARQVAIEETGSADPAVVIEVLARMCEVFRRGASSGLLRLKPLRASDFVRKPVPAALDHTDNGESAA